MVMINRFVLKKRCLKNKAPQITPIARILKPLTRKPRKTAENTKMLIKMVAITDSFHKNSSRTQKPRKQIEPVLACLLLLRINRYFDLKKSKFGTLI